MKRILGILLAGTALATSSVASAQMNALPPQRHLLVYGEADARAIPDRFSIKISFDVVDPSADVARRKVEASVADVLAALDKAGVPEGEIVATSMDIEPRERYDARTEEDVYEGMGVSREVTARFSDLDALEAFIGGLETSESLQVSGITTSLSSEAALKAALRAKSIAATRAKAEEMAQAFGVRLDGVYSVSDVAPQFSYGIQPGTWSGGYQWYRESGTLDAISVTGSRIDRTVSLRTGYVTFSDKIYAVFLIAD